MVVLVSIVCKHTLILASNYLHHMNSYPASLSSKGQSKQSFRVLTNHPAGVKMYKNRWNNSKTGAATSMYTQWAKKWTSGCNEYIPQKLRSTLLEIFFLAIMFEKNSVSAASLKLHIFIDFSPHCTMIKIRSTACVIWTMGRRHAHIDTPPWPFQFDFFIHFRPSFKHITSQKYFYLSDALLSKRCRLFIRP